MSVSMVGDFAKFKKATISFVISVCRSIRPHGTARLTLDGFSLNFIFRYFSKICREVQVSLKPDNSNGTSQEFLCPFITISRSVLLTVRNDTDGSCVENQNRF